MRQEGGGRKPALTRGGGFHRSGPIRERASAPFLTDPLGSFSSGYPIPLRAFGNVFIIFIRDVDAVQEAPPPESLLPREHGHREANPALENRPRVDKVATRQKKHRQNRRHRSEITLDQRLLWRLQPEAGPLTPERESPRKWRIL